jgi:hypothetical protein
MSASISSDQARQRLTNAAQPAIAYSRARMKQSPLVPGGQLFPHFPKKVDTLEFNRSPTLSCASKVDHEHS